jgi:hypothetical protein
MIPIWKDDTLRGTGRTTRMLKAAIETAKTGAIVTVVATTIAQAASFHRYAEDLLRDYADDQGDGAARRVLNRMQFVRKGSALAGRRDVFVDHTVMEVLAEEFLG